MFRAALGAVLLVSSVGRAQPRRIVDLEPLTPLFASGHRSRVPFATVGVTFGWGDTLLAYVGGALGLVTAEGRAGVDVLPNGLASGGLLFRLEARPQVFLGPCPEPALLGNAGVGYRWPLEPSYPEVRQGAALYVLPSFDGGVGWIRTRCVSDAGPSPLERTLLLGGSVALGLDW